MIIGLDISTSCGLATWSEGTSAPRLLTVLLPSDPGEVGRPMEKLRKTLADLHTVEPITHLFFEATILPGKTTAQTVYKLCALAGMAEWFGHRIGAATRQVQQQDWRKHFLGRGTGGRDELKRLAMEASRLRGWAPKNNDEADAVGVLDYGLACFGIKAPWRDAHLMGGAARPVA
jgi:hypothetical protein